MKKVKVTCDACGAPVRRNFAGERQFATLRMRTDGYKLIDGDHRYRWDICSAECGLALLGDALREIHRPPSEATGTPTHAEDK